MKIIIAGTRTFADKRLLESTMHEYPSAITEIVSGGAQGADRCGEDYARLHNLNLTIFKADWDAHGKAAGPIRNRKMAQYADAAVVFWDGSSSGSKNMITEMRRLGKPVKIIIYCCA